MVVVVVVMVRAFWVRAWVVMAMEEGKGCGVSGGGTKGREIYFGMCGIVFQ